MDASGGKMHKLSVQAALAGGHRVTRRLPKY